MATTNANTDMAVKLAALEEWYTFRGACLDTLVYMTKQDRGLKPAVRRQQIAEAKENRVKLDTLYGDVKAKLLSAPAPVQSTAQKVEACIARQADAREHRATMRASLTIIRGGRA